MEQEPVLLPAGTFVGTRIGGPSQHWRQYVVYHFHFVVKLMLIYRFPTYAAEPDTKGLRFKRDRVRNGLVPAPNENDIKGYRS